MNQPDNTSLPPQLENVTWKVLIVDDEDDVHQITRFFLADFIYAGRKLTLLSAYSSAEAQRMLRAYPDIAVALLDVVMETTDAGLKLVEFIREGLHNRFIRIILRTAEQDYAPEEDVVRRYEIDGYATKMALNARKLFTLLTAALRAYAHITELEAQRNLLEEKVAERTRELYEKNEELSDANKALISLDHEKDELMSVLAHDIKNALFAIRGLSEEIYKTKPPPSDDIRRYAEMIYATAQKSFGVIINFLDLDALETGRLHIRLHAVDILPELHVIVTQYTESAKNKNIKIRFEHSAPSYEAYVDENLVQQVLDNLVSNAVKYSPPNTTVTISLSSDDQWVHCEVRDQGPGLTQMDKQKLFSKFARLSATPTGDEHSTGLGLYITGKLVEAMKGRVWCKSQWGQGAAFIVEFPTTKAAGAKSVAEDDETPLPRLRILLAEDNPVNQSLVLMMLKKLGYRADVANDGEEVLDALARQVYDIILMDVQMPNMDGWEATRRIIRTYPRNKHPWIVAMSADTSLEARRQCLKAGMHEHLGKPFKKESLRQVFLEYVKHHPYP